MTDQTTRDPAILGRAWMDADVETVHLPSFGREVCKLIEVPVERDGSWWRVGSKVGRTIYLCHADNEGGTLVGLMDTPERRRGWWTR